MHDIIAMSYKYDVIICKYISKLELQLTWTHDMNLEQKNEDDDFLLSVKSKIDDI